MTYAIYNHLIKNNASSASESLDIPRNKKIALAVDVITAAAFITLGAMILATGALSTGAIITAAAAFTAGAAILTVDAIALKHFRQSPQQPPATAPEPLPPLTFRVAPSTSASPVPEAVPTATPPSPAPAARPYTKTVHLKKILHTRQQPQAAAPDAAAALPRSSSAPTPPASEAASVAAAAAAAAEPLPRSSSDSVAPTSDSQRPLSLYEPPTVDQETAIHAFTNELATFTISQLTTIQSSSGNCRAAATVHPLDLLAIACSNANSKIHLKTAMNRWFGLGAAIRHQTRSNWVASLQIHDQTQLQQPSTIAWFTHAMGQSSGSLDKFFQEQNWEGLFDKVMSFVDQ